MLRRVRGSMKKAQVTFKIKDIKGLESLDNFTSLWVADALKDIADKYVPYKTGNLSRTAYVDKSTATIVYADYSKYLYNNYNVRFNKLWHNKAQPRWVHAAASELSEYISDSLKGKGFKKVM